MKNEIDITFDEDSSDGFVSEEDVLKYVSNLPVEEELKSVWDSYDNLESKYKDKLKSLTLVSKVINEEGLSECFQVQLEYLKEIELEAEQRLNSSKNTVVDEVHKPYEKERIMQIYKNEVLTDKLLNS